MIRRHHLAIATVLALSTLTAGPAEGFRQPRNGAAPGFVLRDGRHTRVTPTVTTRVPRAAEGPWRLLRAELGGQWIALWDEATGIPKRLWGTGVSAPQANGSGAAAAAFAELFLQRHLRLLAPGAAPADFELVTNLEHRGLRTVAYRQLHQGLPVMGGQVSFRFKNDRLMLVASDALPAVNAMALPGVVDVATAQARAEAWLQSELGTQGTTTQMDGPFILPLVGEARVLDDPVVLRVLIETTQPLGLWAVYLDAASGRPLAREQTLRFAEGTVLYDAPVRYPAAGRQAYPAKRASVTIEGALKLTDDNGVVIFDDGASVPLVTKPTGTGIHLINDAGPEATGTFTLDPGGTVTWSAPTEPEVDAQVSAFNHGRIAKDFALQLAPELTWLAANLQIKVNIADSCNAFYNGSSINFLQGDSQCENTARLADVIYHEFGHGLHHHAVILGAGQFESALSEGLSDYYAATITDDPKTAPGFYYSAEPLRDIDPEYGDAEWPYDVHYDPHQTGLIIGGALWDLRKLLAAKLGEEAGIARANELYFQAMRTASDIPTMYPEILAADDDDGDLANGTPNVCEIISAFASHGLRFVATEMAPLAVEPPEAEGYEVQVTIGGLFDQCPGDQIESAKIRWRLRRNPNQLDTVVMTGGPDSTVGVIPQQTEGEVIRYRVDLEPAIGTTQSFPDNRADPMAELFVGDVTDIYCTDFETDPFAEGWTHGLLEGTDGKQHDEWEWGAPEGTERNGDPPEAFSGAHVLGTDLGQGSQDGLYEPSTVSYLDSPPIDVSEASDPRLHFQRWLQVEDGYFDGARILVNDEPVWESYGSPNEPATTHHTDRVWRFQDIDLRPYVASDGTVTIRFELAADSNGVQRGGWNLDDFCIVDFLGALPGPPQCGNGQVEPGEECDDGNVVSGDGCASFCMLEDEPAEEPEADPPADDGGCGCRLAGSPSGRPYGLLGWVAAIALARRRRRSA